MARSNTSRPPLPLAFFNAGPLALVLSDGSGEKLPATPAATRSAHLASGPYTLSGTIYGGSSLLVNAQVALMDSSRTTVPGLDPNRRFRHLLVLRRRWHL